MGNGNGGFTVPGGNFRVLDLDIDATFLLWLALPIPLRQVVLSNGCAGDSTFSVAFPGSISLGTTFYYGGLSVDLVAGTMPSVTETKSFVSQ